MEIETWMWVIWLSLLVVTLIVEAASAALLSIWFSAGALAALILSFIPEVPYWVEVIVFLGVSLVTFLAIRPFLKKLMAKRISKSNVDTIVGKTGVIVKETSHLNPGEVKVGNMVWTALPVSTAHIFKEGDIVLVSAIEGNKLLVSPVAKEAE